METSNLKEITVTEEASEEVQIALYSALEELAFFLKQCPMDGSFKCSAIRDIIKLGLGQERPYITNYIMPVASSCLPMLLGFLADWNLQTLEDNLLCAEAASALLNMYPSKPALTLISHCFRQLKDDPNSYVDLSQDGTDVCLKLLVSKPLNFKLCLTRGLLRFRHCLTHDVLSYMAEPIVTACYQYSSFTCLGFRSLHMWLSNWEKMGFCLDNTTAHNIYSIVANNWENPVPGVRRDNVKVFSILLDVSCPRTKFTTEAVFQHVMTNLSWKMKSKYFSLSVLIPKIGVLKALQQYPSIVPALVTTLGINRLCYAGADVYRVCVADLPDADSWCQWFLEPVWAIMTSHSDDQRLAQLNLLSRWVTPTLRLIPALTQTLRDMLMSVESGNLKVNLALSALLHQGRKEGFVTDLWPVYSFIDHFLTSGDEEVRKHAFGAVCKRTKKAVIPPSEEFEAVKKFLKENVNSDNTTLRQSLVDSFFYFLERLHESSEKLAMAKHKEEYPSLMPVFTFLQWLHKFLLKNMETGGNYQRKVSSLQLYLEVLRCFGPGKLKASQQPDSLRLMAKKLDMWHFDSDESWHVLVECILCPTDDIQKGAGEILSNHLKLLDDEGSVQRMEKFWHLALRQCSSALFYEAESGRILMKLITLFVKQSPSLSQIFPPIPKIVINGESVDLLLEAFNDISMGMETGSSESSASDTGDQSGHNTETEDPSNGERNADNLKHSSTLQPLVAYMYYELQRQWCAVEKDLFKAVTSGTPLHSVLAAMAPLVPYFSQFDVARLLFLLGKIMDHYLSVLSGQAENLVSPSFSEMTQAIDSMIPEDESEGFSTQLSPSHQLVLSCVWLTLKECCNLAASLLCHPEASGLDALRCLMLVERILLRCRYKGTIEAAGTAMGIMVRHVTCDQETRRCVSSFIPDCGDKLSDFLQDMLSDVLKGVTVYSNKTSITRRSAGIGILVQKLVAADSRPDKPLLKICVRKLCETVEIPPPDDHTVEECDLPQACALHLLCRLVQDASLRQEMTPFASTIALLCFETFSSPTWTVQNAALQLFGVLVPLLIGEKKVQDDDIETFGNLTSEEFFSHHPSLVTFFLEEMKKCTNEASTAKEIVPILSFLSKLTLGDSLSLDNCGTEIEDLQKYLNLLMRTSDLDAKKIAAKCFSRFVPKESLHLSINELLNEINKADKLPDNHTYGILVTVLHLVNRLVEEGADAETLRSISENFHVKSLLEASWVSTMTALDVMRQLDRHGGGGYIRDYVNFIKFVLSCLERYSFKGMVPAGVYSWATQCVDFALEMCKDKELCPIWTMLYTSDWDEHSDVCLRRIMERVPSLPMSINEELMNTLMSCVSNGWKKDWDLLCSIYEILLVMMPFVTLITSSRIINTILKNAKKECGVQCWSVALPLACEMFSSHIRNFGIIPDKDIQFLKLLAVETLNRTSAEDCVAESRVCGARAFVALFRELSSLYSCNTEIESITCYIDIVSIVLDSGIAYLQDEDTSVRREASKIVVPEQNTYTCLLSLLSVSGLCRVLGPFQTASYFMNKLLDFSSYKTLLTNHEGKSKCVVSTSLFDYGQSNIYAEETHVLQLMSESFLNLLQENPSWLEDLPALPEEQTVKDLVTRLLQIWKTSENGSAAITFEMHTLLVRLDVLAKVSGKMFVNASSNEYVNLTMLLTSNLKIC